MRLASSRAGSRRRWAGDGAALRALLGQGPPRVRRRRPRARDVGVAANLAKLAGGQTGGALVESVTAPLKMTQHGWDKLYAEYKESGE